MRPYVKAGLVLAGYAAALAIALVAVTIRIRTTSAQGSDGMYAFGDLIFFVAVFGALALVPTGAALFFLMTSRIRRPH